MEPEIAFLDDNQELRELLSTYLMMRLKAPCIQLSSYQDVKDSLSSVLKTRAAILDIELGYDQPSGLDVYDLLLANGYQGQIFFLTGHGHTHPLVQQAMRSNCIVWEKPVSVITLVEALRKVLGHPSSVEQTHL